MESEEHVRPSERCSGIGRNRQGADLLPGNLQARGKLFVEHGQEIYNGQIVGLNGSLPFDVSEAGKELDNMRASGKDETIALKFLFATPGTTLESSRTTSCAMCARNPSRQRKPKILDEASVPALPKRPRS